MKRLHLAVAAVVGIAASLPAAAQFQKPEDAIKYRQGAFNVMAAHFGRIAAMANGKAPFDAKAAADNAAIVLALSKLPMHGFVDGSTSGAPHRAKAEIWKDAAKFKAAGEKMQTEVVKLDAAAKTGNLDQIKAAVNGVGGSCKGCHDDFRAEKYSN